MTTNHENCPSCKVIANIVTNVAKAGRYSDGLHGVTVSTPRK